MYKKITHQAAQVHSFVTTSQETLVLFLEMIFGVFLTIGSAFVFLKIRAEVLEKEFLNFDMQILHFFYVWRTPVLNWVMFALSMLGSYLILFAFILFLIIFLRKKHRREAFLFSLLIVMGEIINLILKSSFARPRPQYFPLITMNDYSFPSAHAMQSFVFYASISYFIFHFTKRKKLSLAVSVGCFVLILLIGISRIYLGVHYPSDVLAGYFGGLAWFSSVLLIDKTLIFFKLFRERHK